MSAKSLVPRMIGIAVAVVLGVYYIGVVILGHGFGSDGYKVRVTVPDAAGVYAGGGVAYQGVEVGKISKVEVQPDGVNLVLQIGSDHKIPANSHANVRMLSALGEQYVDLVPTSAAGPMLRDGSQIPVSRTTVPVPVSKALVSSQKLLESLDPDDLRSVETLLSEAFSDVTPELKRLVETGQDLTDALIEAQPGTEKIIRDGNTVLKAGNASSDDLRTFVSSFDRLSKQFLASDDDLDKLLANGGVALADIEDLVRTGSGPFKDLMRGAGAAGQAMEKNSAALHELFRIFPDVAARLAGAANGDELTGKLQLNNGDPVCTYASGKLPLVGAKSSGSSPMSCPTREGLQMRGPQNAPKG